ncbi:hypothetical protein [Halosimplex amylolyticum]|uniref:hypothetical protein n=1 Tax=Halosimplex amylolyticum TaxID=3396616 RepID=UPI003F558B24
MQATGSLEEPRPIEGLDRFDRPLELVATVADHELVERPGVAERAAVEVELRVPLDVGLGDETTVVDGYLLVNGVVDGKVRGVRDPLERAIAAHTDEILGPIAHGEVRVFRVRVRRIEPDDGPVADLRERVDRVRHPYLGPTAPHCKPIGDLDVGVVPRSFICANSDRPTVQSSIRPT